MDLKLISQKKYGDVIQRSYLCPCGQGTIDEEQDYTEGFRDGFAYINCSQCSATHYIDWGDSQLSWELKEHQGSITSATNSICEVNCQVKTKLNPNITIVDNERKIHKKASEEYIHVQFRYNNTLWDGWVPVEYRRTGISLKSQPEVDQHLNDVYEQMRPEKFSDWRREQDVFWAGKTRAEKTKPFFDSLVKGGWQCVECTLPKNPNWARRIQALKDDGYTLATDTKHYCPKCQGNTTHILLLPISRANNEGNGYETWSPALHKRIIRVLGHIDVYEKTVSAHCLPDHKFPEIRWDANTKSDNPDSMTDEEIYRKFQLLTNQRNLQKREVCRNFFQTGKRGYPFGIKFYYKGTEDWDPSIPTRGKEAECGCVGCGWYDLAEWRKHICIELGVNKNDT